jgi:hypothetical protein
MKRLVTLGGLGLFFLTTTHAQSVAINNTGAQANASSILDVSSTTKGFLLPRMTAAQRLAILSPATSLQVFQTDAITGSPSGFYFFNGSTWVSMAAQQSAGVGWSLNGNGGTNPTTNFIGTTDATDFKIATNATPRMLFKSTGEIGIGGNPNAVFGLGRVNNTNQPILRIDDGSTTNTAASVLLFNLGNNALIDASTLGTGTMMKLRRDGGANSDGEGLRVENKGTGAAIHSIGNGGIALLGSATNGVGARIESNFTALQTFGDCAADFHSTGSQDGITLAMTGNSNSVQSIDGINVAMTSTGTAPVVGIDVFAKSNTSGTQVVGVLSRPFGTGAASVACFIGEGDMSITGQYLHTSDRKLKKNITPMGGVVDKLMKLAPSDYFYRTDEFKMNLPKNAQHGLIAQELQTVFPELVSVQKIPAKYDSDKKLIAAEEAFLGVNYTGLIPILIKGMQEQQRSIQSLQSENIQLKKDLDAIKAKLGL